MQWLYLTVALVLDAVLVGLIVSKHFYDTGFRHGWISGADKTIDVTRRHGLWLAEYMLAGMKRLYGDTPSASERKYP